MLGKCEKIPIFKPSQNDENFSPQLLPTAAFAASLMKRRKVEKPMMEKNF